MRSSKLGSTVVVTLVLALGHHAGAEPCKQSGAKALEIRHLAQDLSGGYTDTPPTLEYGSFTILDTGFWQLERRDPKKDKVTWQASGCLDKATLQGLRAELAKATWKTAKGGAACDRGGLFGGYALWAVENKAVMLDASCTDSPDAVTEKAIATVSALEKKLGAKAPTPKR